MCVSLYKKLGIFILFLCFGGLFSLFMKMFPLYDFMSYHYQNGWAFWNDRLGVDFMTSSLRTYFNPIIDALNFFVLQKLNFHPKLFLFVSGFKYGCFMFLSWLIFDKFFKNSGFEKIITSLFSLLLIFFSPMLIYTLGFDWIDIQIACFVLLSIYIYLSNLFDSESKHRTVLIFVSAMILGMVIGLKYSASVYAVSFFAVLFLRHKDLKTFLKISLILLVGMFTGYLITNGFWLYLLFKNFSNPIFPYLNNIFHSPFGIQSPIFDYDFQHVRPNSFWSLVFLPLANTLRGPVPFEFFFDLKISLTFFLSVLYLVLRIKKSGLSEKINSLIDIKILDACLIILTFSFYINACIFGHFRFILALIPFTCIIITTFIYTFAGYLKKINLIIILLFALISFIGYLVFARYDILFIFVFILYVLLLFSVFFVHFSKKLSVFHKNYFTLCSLILFCFIGFTRLTHLNIAYPFSCGSVLKIEDAKIEDGSNVLLGTILSGFVVPSQNESAKYTSYALQDNFQALRDKYAIGRPLTIKEYTSPYLINKVSEILNNEGSVYFIFAENDLLPLQSINFNIYQNSILNYTNNKYSLSEEMCNPINYVIFGNQNMYKNFVICKIK